MFSVLVFLTIIQVTHASHIVFEEAEEISGAISYIHIIQPMDLPDLKEKADHCLQQVWDFKKITIAQRFQWSNDEFYEVKYTKDIQASYD